MKLEIEEQSARTAMRSAVELSATVLAGLVLAAWRLNVRARHAPFERPVAALALAGALVAGLAVVAARRSHRREAPFWALIAAAALAWEPGRPAPAVATRGALLFFNGSFVVSMALFAVGLSLAIHMAASAGARQKLALDVIPQVIGLATIAWIGWIGPQALTAGGHGWARAITAGHGLAAVLMIGLCAAGMIGRRQGVVGAPAAPLLAGVGLLALGDLAALPVWNQWDNVLTAGSQCLVGAGFALIGLAACRAWRPAVSPVVAPAAPATGWSWTGQAPNFILIGLLFVAIGEDIFGQRVPGGIVIAVAAGMVIIVFGVVRQSLTQRSERRLRQEIDQLSAQIDGLVSQVGRDPLTGLLNHRAVHERLELEIDQARAVGGSLAVALIDVDNFKTVNDQRGHQAGDRVLRAISSILIAACRGTDVAARYAGDEFMLILPGLDEGHVAAVCERIVDEVRRVNRYLNLGQDIDVTLSVGVAVSHRWTHGAAKIIGVADAAMYDAKESGKDQVVVVNADTMLATLPARRVREIPTGGLPLMPTAVRPKDRRRLTRFERVS